VLSDPYWNLLKPNLSFLKQMQVIERRCHSMALIIFQTHENLPHESYSADVHCYATDCWSHFCGNQPMQQLLERISMAMHERNNSTVNTRNRMQNPIIRKFCFSGRWNVCAKDNASLGSTRFRPVPYTV
jgi:hypothetical protein